MLHGLGFVLNARDFKSSASTSSAMAACIVVIIADRTRPVKQAGRRKLRLFFKHTLIQRAVLVRDDRGADRVARDVDRRARHIQDAVDAHNQPNAGNRQADRVEHHRQRHQADRGDAGRADRSERGRGDDGQVIRGRQRDAERLRDEYDRHTLHDGGAVHVDRRAERDRERRDAPRHSDLFLQRFDGERDGCVRGRGGERKAHDRREFPDEPERVEAGKQLEQDLIHTEALHQQRQQDGRHIFEHGDHRGKAQFGESFCD